MPDGVVWITVGLAALAAVGMVWCCLHDGQAPPEERKEEACAWCLRWDECNGVDEECPVRGGDGQVGKFRFSLKVQCLYYDGERNQELFCKGLTEGSRIHQGFAHPGMMDQWKERYCECGHQECPVARMLAEQGVEP